MTNYQNWWGKLKKKKQILIRKAFSEIFAWVEYSTGTKYCVDCWISTKELTDQPNLTERLSTTIFQKQTWLILPENGQVEERTKNLDVDKILTVTTKDVESKLLYI